MEKLNCFQLETNIKIAKRAELRKKIKYALWAVAILAVVGYCGGIEMADKLAIGIL